MADTPLRPYPKNPLDPNDPNYDPVLDPHNSQYNPNDPRLVGGPYMGPRSPQGIIAGPPLTGPQQPSIPIQTAQGAPQTPTQMPQTAPNSGVVGSSPFANMALTGGGGQPIGGLPTQQPMAPLNGSINPQRFNFSMGGGQTPQSAQPQMQMLNGPMRPQINPQYMQNIAALLQRYRSLGV